MPARIFSFFLVSLLLNSCALSPVVLRQKLDECDHYGFDALVYRRARDGAVVRVLCVPVDEDMDLQVKAPPLIPRLIRRLAPLIPLPE